MTMKKIFAILSTVSLLNAQTVELLPEDPIVSPTKEEIAAFDPVIVQKQQPVSIDLPAPVYSPPSKSPLLAATFSGIIPGLGHAYLNDFHTAGEIFGSAAGGLVFVPIASQFSDSLPGFGLHTFSASASYGVYAAYRDARKMIGHAGYYYPMPTDSFSDLISAPFSWSVVKKPEVWGGLLGALTVAAGLSYLSPSEDVRIGMQIQEKRSTSPLCAFPVGLGEEAFFRGYLQTQLSEWFSPTLGLTFSSLLFGAAHISNAVFMSKADQGRYLTYSIPFITAFGAYFGWMTQKNCSLKESVALHTWYDFILFAIDAASNASIGKPQSFSYSFSF
jgi:membrane protease YdiL (CAAX protease family)